MKLPVYVLAVRDFQDRDNFLGIFDFVDHPVTPDSDSPARHVAQLPRPGRSRVVLQRGNSGSNGVVIWGIQSKNLFFGRRQDDKTVAHLRFRWRSILPMASSNGTPTSPEAFASWYSRRASASSNSSSISSYSLMLMTTAIFSPFSSVRNCFGRVMETYFLYYPSVRGKSGHHLQEGRQVTGQRDTAIKLEATRKFEQPILRRRWR